MQSCMKSLSQVLPTPALRTQYVLFATELRGAKPAARLGGVCERAAGARRCRYTERIPNSYTTPVATSAASK